MKTYAEKIADYVVQVSFDDLPAEVVAKCKQIVLDTIGVAILGADAPWSRIITDYHRTMGGAAQSSVIGSNFKLPMAQAAFINGALAHALDYDDDLYAVHVACSIVPAVLAAAEHLGSSGKEIITAISIGYDIAIRLVKSLDGHHLYAMGLHPTPVCGGFGAAAAVSKLLGLSEKQTTSALGIAGSFASGGLECLSDGSMTKRMQGGKGAGEGVTAASLAKLNYTGPRMIFEGDHGIFHIFHAQGDPQNLVADFFDFFPITRSYTKLHACCTCSAPVIDAVFALKSEEKIDWRLIKDIEIRLRNTCLPLVGRPLERKQRPETVFDAQMSAPYAAAVALLKDNAYPDQFVPEKIHDPDLHALSAKVQVKGDVALDLDGDPRPVPAVVKINMEDGRTLTKRIDYQKGTYKNPAGQEDLENKFSVCVAGRLSEPVKQELTGTLASLESLPHIRDMMALL